jgi:DNA-binding transcriptional LysR family regulator
MDRLDAMRAFAGVADLGSFAGAARRLRLSPASVTRAVAMLEDQLGVLLLSRTTRSVRLTEPGTLYLQNCRQVLAAIEEAERQVRGGAAIPRGLLTISAPVMFGRMHVLPIVQNLLRAHPELRIRLLLSDRLVHLVEEGVDVAVRIGDPADSALVAVRVGEIRRVAVASPAYLAAHGTPATPAALARHDLIAFEGLDLAGEWRFGGRAEPVVRVDPRLAVSSADAALAAAEAGFGITRPLSYQAHAAVQEGRLRLLLEDFALPPMPVSVLHPPLRLGSANVAAFVAAAQLGIRKQALLF